MRPVAAPASVVGELRLSRQRRPVGVDRLRSVLVINLESRPDRLQGFLSEMTRLEIRADRFDAIADPNGMLGCTLSHAECLRPFVEEPRGCVMVCEDDAVFNVTRRRLDLIVERFLADDRAEVACLAFQASCGTLRPYSPLFMRGSGILTTACYLAKSSIVGDLRSVWLEAAAALANGGDSRRHGLDTAWWPLQHTRVFLVPIVRAVRQRAGYSDIREKIVAYDV